MITPNQTFLVADDHPLFKKGIVELLRSLNVANIILEASNGKEVLDIAKAKKIDLFLLDYKMPGLDGYVLSEKLLALDQKSKIIVLSIFSSESLIAALYWVGVRAFLVKDSDPEEIAATIQCVLGGNQYFPKYFSEEKYRQHQQKQVKPMLPHFTDHEKGIVLLLSKGRTSSQIALLLKITVNTVETYRVRLHEKAGVPNTAALVDFFHRNGLF
jgi:DNA-binding NarL/FixJ family response regulator